MKQTNTDTKQKNKGGRPRVSPNSAHMRLTLSQDDIDLLQTICSYTGSRPATMVRELLQEARPTLLAMAEALEANKNGTNPPAGSLAGKMLEVALQRTEPTQNELFDIVKDSL